MTFTDILLSLINKKGITKNKMLIDLKLAKGSFANWEARGTIPNGETLSKIANYFNVSTDYLLGNSDIKKAPPAKAESARTKAINEINAILDEMTEEEQQQALNVLRALCANNSKTEK